MYIPLTKIMSSHSTLYDILHLLDNRKNKYDFKNIGPISLLNLK